MSATLTPEITDTALGRKSLSILLADDVDEIRRLMAAWLEGQGHLVGHASTGREAIRYGLNHPCDLVITDVLMPDNDGLDVIVALRRSHPETRFLAISGGGQYMTATDAIHLADALGADSHLFKPFTRDQFFEAIDHALTKRRR
ncbi:MAG: response regulator [Verrucomicrobiota bacterium]